jgi:hypothetical protein
MNMKTAGTTSQKTIQTRGPEKNRLTLHAPATGFRHALRENTRSGLFMTVPHLIPKTGVIFFVLIFLASLCCAGSAADAAVRPVFYFSTNNTTSVIEPLPVLFGGTTANTRSVRALDSGDRLYSLSWRNVNASPGWSARIFPSSVVLPDGSIVLTGGGLNTLDDRFADDVWRSGDTGATWTEVTAHAGWTARTDHSSVAMPDGSVVLTGGFNRSDNGPMNDVWRSEDGGRTWTLLNSSPGWTARGFHSSVAMPDGSIVLMGGMDENGLKNDVWRSEDGGTTWTQLPDARWTARTGQSSILLPDGSILLTGGLDGNSIKNDVWRSEDGGETWTLVNASAGWLARGFHSSVALPDGSIVLMGGEDINFMNDTWRSEDGGTTWAQLPDARWTARGGQSSAVMPDGSIVLMGGMDESGIKNDVWQLNPSGSEAQDPAHAPSDAGGYAALVITVIMIAVPGIYFGWRRSGLGKKR